MKGTLDRAVEALVRHRLVALLASVAVVGVMGAYAARLSVDNSLEVWFVEDDPTVVSYRGFLEQFGNDEVVVTAIHGTADPFDPGRLERLWHLSRELEAIDGVDRVRSLANVKKVQGSMLGPVIVPVVAPPVKDDDVDRARDLIARRHLASDLVGQDGKTLVLFTWLDATPTIDTERGRIIDEIRATTESWLVRDERASHGGVGVMHEALNEVTLSDGARFIGLSYAVVAFVLYAVTRRVVWTVLALVAVSFADLALFGLMTLAGRSINMITIALPPLVMILGVANVVHMSTEIDISLTRPASGVRKLTRSLARISRPCLFNMFTTAAAFLSLGTASMAVTRDYGIFAAVGVVLAFVFSVVGTAAMIPHAANFRPPAGASRRVGSFVERLMLLSVRHRVLVVALTVLLAAGALYGAGRIVVDTASFEFLPGDHPARTDADTIEESVGPSFPLEMTLRVAETGGWRKAEFLGALATAQAELESVEAIGRTTTAGDVLRDVHVAVTGEELERPWRPEYDEDVENLTALLDATGHEGVLKSWVAEDDRTLRLTATTPMATAREFWELAERARSVTQRAFGDRAEVALGGYLPLYSQIVRHTLDDQVTSFTLAFLTVFVIVTLVLGSWRYAVVAIPPNLLPVGLVLGVMGFAGIRLDLATVTVAAVVMGIIVDDSVHVLYRLRRELTKGRSFEESIAHVARSSGVAVVSTSLVFTAGFLVISFAASDAVGNPGLLTAVAVIAALTTDLFLLPAFASFLFATRHATEFAAEGTRSRQPVTETG
jgi:predicted RND superfamily exporter protein